jgi:hypothetical protein
MIEKVNIKMYPQYNNNMIKKFQFSINCGVILKKRIFQKCDISHQQNKKYMIISIDTEKALDSISL